MFRIVIEKLIYLLKCHNLSIKNGLRNPHEEIQIDLLLEILEKYGVKVAITTTNPHNKKSIKNALEHASHRMAHSWGNWIYESIDFNFKNLITDDGDEFEALMLSLNGLELEWPTPIAATCNKLTF